MTIAKAYDFKGKRALVTGAGRGIVKAFAKSLAQNYQHFNLSKRYGKDSGWEGIEIASFSLIIKN